MVLTKTLVDGFTLNKIMVSFNAGYSNYRNKDLFILLDDGEVIKSDEATTDCHMLDAHTFFYIGIMDLSESDIDKLKSHKVVKVRIGIEERDINEKSAIKLQTYLPCVFSDENK